ncbi:MAG: hypothetical protein HY000_35445 [Planctomycetes bacterium]|nr:hypothetical protein [Planctomycetota bacterium]
MYRKGSGFSRAHTGHSDSRNSQRIHRHERSGEVPVKALIAIAVFLVIGALVKWAITPGPAVTVLESRRVSATHLGGGPVNVDLLRLDISSDAVQGMSLTGAMRAAALAGAAEASGDESGPKGTAEGSRMVEFQQDPQGKHLLVRLRLSREFLEKQGKVSNLTAALSTQDTLLQPSGGTAAEPVFLLSGQRDEIQTKKGKATRFTFGEGNTCVLEEKVPQALWLAVGQIKSTQELSSSVELTCLFGSPPGSTGLQLRVLNVETIDLK